MRLTEYCYYYEVFEVIDAERISFIKHYHFLSTLQYGLSFSDLCTTILFINDE